MAQVTLVGLVVAMVEPAGQLGRHWVPSGEAE